MQKLNGGLEDISVATIYRISVQIKTIKGPDYITCQFFFLNVRICDPLSYRIKSVPISHYRVYKKVVSHTTICGSAPARSLRDKFLYSLPGFLDRPKPAFDPHL
ncbi:hypothetical protein BpHYR1_050245 [Brachionus plicatilis]|uniref:Uncharacterized protein n=1 Tax=Brachionus plicatilis TaxID=10195 RepID=A0A3M7RJZ9_BRAPC|nr:hypothetical protein BpHYR1_050245 [Brachionus plicatilis]